MTMSHYCKSTRFILIVKSGKEISIEIKNARVACITVSDITTEWSQRTWEEEDNC